MVLRLDSRSTTPHAIAALSSGAKLAHVPNPRMKQSTSILPARVTPRSLVRGETGVGAVHHGNSSVSKSSIAVITTPDRRPAIGVLTGIRITRSQITGSFWIAGRFQAMGSFLIMANRIVENRVMESMVVLAFPQLRSRR